MGNEAEPTVYGSRYVVVTSVVPAGLIQRVNRKKPLFTSVRSPAQAGVLLRLRNFGQNRHRHDAQQGRDGSHW
jgi:hypothetical protein